MPSRPVFQGLFHIVIAPRVHLFFLLYARVYMRAR